MSENFEIGTIFCSLTVKRLNGRFVFLIQNGQEVNVMRLSGAEMLKLKAWLDDPQNGLVMTDITQR